MKVLSHLENVVRLQTDSLCNDLVQEVNVGCLRCLLVHILLIVFKEGCLKACLCKKLGWMCLVIDLSFQLIEQPHLVVMHMRIHHGFQTFSISCGGPHNGMITSCCSY